MLLPLLLSAFLTTSEAPQNDSIKTSWMNNISVTGEKRQVMYRLDRRRIAASTNLAASGGTALDVLKTIPSVAIDADGNVYVNSELLEEPYVTEMGLGDCDLEFPYQVPENAYFMMGDHRETSVDSRSSVIGGIAEDQIIGKILFRIWPLSQFEWMG